MALWKIHSGSLKIFDRPDDLIDEAVDILGFPDE
jgi:hypothetical protein